MHYSIFEMPFSGMPGARMYQAQIVPEEFPDQRQMWVSNWHPEDQIAYCGGSFAKAAYTK